MPWNKQNYPDSLKNFRAEGRTIAIATAQAKEWADNQDKEVRKN